MLRARRDRRHLHPHRAPGSLGHRAAGRCTCSCRFRRPTCLDWDETVRLDLYYVENWSIAFDFLILWRTAFAVLQGRGAY
jgi:lipopolysaccharide/colanic/teichoic acid biosynthesis glycosyltransferase